MSSRTYESVARKEFPFVLTNLVVTSCTATMMNGMCVAIGDYDDDLDLQLFVTNTPEGHALLRNNNGTFSH